MDKTTKRILCFMLVLVIIAVIYFFYMLGFLVGTHRTVDYFNQPKLEAYREYRESINK